MERIPLSQRFKMAERNNPNFLKTFDMRLNDYLSALNSLIGEEAAGNISNEIYDLLPEKGNSKMGIAVVSTIGLFEVEHEYMNYAILVDAFAKMSIYEWEKEL